MDFTPTLPVVNYLWGLAQDLSRSVCRQGGARDLILPMTLLRRLELLLEPTKELVLRMKDQLDQRGITDQHSVLRQTAGQPFYNTSPFTLATVLSQNQNLRAAFNLYLQGFSPEIRQLLEAADVSGQLEALESVGALGTVLERFVSPELNLGPQPIFDGLGRIRLPGLNHPQMSKVFDDLLQRFTEEEADEFGGHCTPSEVTQLMVNLVFLPIRKQIASGSYSLYDPAVGTGGLLSAAEVFLRQSTAELGKDVRPASHGQEANLKVGALAQMSLLLRGMTSVQILPGSSLSADAFPQRQFDFMLAHPPLGRTWKPDLDRLREEEKTQARESRFIISHDGDTRFSLATRPGDSQLMFLVNMLLKMRPPSENVPGSRLAVLLSTPALQGGDAGQGESNIRQWILENDWLEAVVGLPENLCYDTPGATYLWILSNNKPAHRRGKVQLIDATTWFTPLDRPIGQRRVSLSDAHRDQITRLYLDCKPADCSQLVDNDAFGYQELTIDRPLRLRVTFAKESVHRFRAECAEADDEAFAQVVERVASRSGAEPHRDFNLVWGAIVTAAKQHGLKLSPKRRRLFRDYFCQLDDKAERVFKDVDAADEAPLKYDAAQAQIYGEFEVHGLLCRFEADPSLRDHDKIPLSEDPETYFQREVQPHAPEAWIGVRKSVKGYTIHFTRSFCHYQPLRTLEEISTDLMELEQEAAGLFQRLLTKREPS